MADYLQFTTNLEPNRLYKGSEVAALLGVHIMTIYAWMKAEKFPRPHRVGPRTVRWSGSQIIGYLQKNADDSAKAEDQR